MRSSDRFHSPAPEELMAYVDGEGSADARAAIAAHLANCAACQSLVDDQRRLTGTLQEWHVPPAPASLQPREARAVRPWWRQPRGIAAGLSAAAAVLVLGAISQRPKPVSAPSAMSIQLKSTASAPSEIPVPAGQRQPDGSVQGNARAALDRGAAGGGSAAQSAAPPSVFQGPSVIRTARLQIVTKDFATARESVESIVAAGGGFVDDMTVTGDTTQARALRGTLRVRADRFRDVLNRLRGLGAALEDTQGTQDVTDQIVDLDARLAGARATEQRLTELVRNRTGRLSDVLEVERELTRVRVEIERLDAEKTNVTRRVSYATINITITEERKESIDGPVSLMTRLRIAALDGLETALDSAAAVVLIALRAGPALALWGGLFAITWLAFRRFGIRDPR